MNTGQKWEETGDDELLVNDYLRFNGKFPSRCAIRLNRSLRACKDRLQYLQENGRCPVLAQAETLPPPPVPQSPAIEEEIVTSPISQIRLVVEEPVHVEELPPLRPQQRNRRQNDDIWTAFAPPMYSEWGEGDDGFQW
jgi:hypothetical protein